MNKVFVGDPPLFPIRTCTGIFRAWVYEIVQFVFGPAVVVVVVVPAVVVVVVVAEVVVVVVVAEVVVVVVVVGLITLSSGTPPQFAKALTVIAPSGTVTTIGDAKIPFGGTVTLFEISISVGSLAV